MVASQDTSPFPSPIAKLDTRHIKRRPRKDVSVKPKSVICVFGLICLFRIEIGHFR